MDYPIISKALDSQSLAAQAYLKASQDATGAFKKLSSSVIGTVSFLDQKLSTASGLANAAAVSLKNPQSDLIKGGKHQEFIKTALADEHMAKTTDEFLGSFFTMIDSSKGKHLLDKYNKVKNVGSMALKGVGYLRNYDKYRKTITDGFQQAKSSLTKALGFLHSFGSGGQSGETGLGNLSTALTSPSSLLDFGRAMTLIAEKRKDSFSLRGAITSSSWGRVSNFLRQQASWMLNQYQSSNKTKFRLAKNMMASSTIMDAITNATETYGEMVDIPIVGTALGTAAAAGVMAEGYTSAANIKAMEYKGRYLGGPVQAGDTYLVGELGPEILHMPSGGYSSSVNETKSLLNAAPRPTIAAPPIERIDLSLEINNVHSLHDLYNLDRLALENAIAVTLRDGLMAAVG